MDETQAFQVLVIILSVTLAIFLVLAIVATVYLIRFLQSANRISEKAEVIVENVEQATDNFARLAAPAAAAQAVMNMFKRK